MLILKRKRNETIRIGDDIIVTVLRIGREDGEIYYRIGIDAPREIPVHRGEIYEKIQAEKREVATE